MNTSFLAVALSETLALTTACAGFATRPTDESVAVSGGYSRGQSQDDRAINSCARTMVRRMFPGTERIQVFANTRDNQVFGNVYDDAMPGFQMAVLLKATDADTGKTLGTAECDVKPNAQVVSLRPGAKYLPPNAAFVRVE